MNATIAAMKHAGVEVTLDNFLRWNLVDPDTVDAELLDAIPAELKEGFLDYLALCEEFDKKFEASLEGR